MIKKKYKQRVLNDHANETYARLRRALRHGRISQQGYKFWKKKVLVAVWEQDHMLTPRKWGPNPICLPQYVCAALLDIKSYLCWD